MKASWRGLLLLLLTLSFGHYASADTRVPNVKTLLANVAHAVRNTNYRGRLTYEHSGKLDVIEVAHNIVNGAEYERVYYLNGPDRSLVRPGRSLDCVIVGASLMRGGRIRLSDGSLAQLKASYVFKLAGTERVSGRNAWVIQLIPKDQHRHSFILSVDTETFLPLKSLFVAKGRKVLERLHFVSLEIDPAFEEGTFDVSNSQALMADNDYCLNDQIDIKKSAWQPRWVPTGFVRTSYSYSQEDGHMETYTDGLTSFSVFARGIDKNTEPEVNVAVSKNLKRGATVIVKRLLLADSSMPVRVSVVGEIPLNTAGQILASVNSVQP